MRGFFAALRMTNKNRQRRLGWDEAWVVERNGFLLRRQSACPSTLLRVEMTRVLGGLEKNGCAGLGGDCDFFEVGINSLKRDLGGDGDSSSRCCFSKRRCSSRSRASSSSCVPSSAMRPSTRTAIGRRCGGGDAVGDEDRGAALHDFAQAGEDLLLGVGVDGGQCVVEDEDAGVAEHGAGDGGALLLAAGEGDAALADHGVEAAGEFENLVAMWAAVGGV